MPNIHYSINLPVIVLREGRRYVAFTPALDLSTSGTTFMQAKKRFVEAVDIFFEELTTHGTLPQVLSDLGWRHEERKWQAPVVVGHEMTSVTVPVR